jgi:hypothetical protein
VLVLYRRSWERSLSKRAVQRLVAGVAAAVCMLEATRVAAQTNTAEIRGVVKDPLGGLLPGASVVAPPGGTRGAALEQAGTLPAVLGQRSGQAACARGEGQCPRRNAGGRGS